MISDVRCVLLLLLWQGYEVIYFTDVLDEYLMGHLTEYDDKKFANISKVSCSCDCAS